MARTVKTCTALILDAETTGLGAEDEIIEIGMVLFRYAISSGEVMEVLDTYSALREPGCPIGKTAQRVNGITADMVRGQALDHQRIADFIARAERIYAHNAAFDYRFATRLIPSIAQKPWTCTMYGVPWVAEGAPNRRLGDLVAHFGTATAATHRALDDAHALLSLIRLQGANGKAHLARLHRRKPYIPTAERDARPPQPPMEICISLDEPAASAPPAPRAHTIGSAIGRLFVSIFK
jgi:DNA polymerase-3 subunit epsilon